MACPTSVVPKIRTAWKNGVRLAGRVTGRLRVSLKQSFGQPLAFIVQCQNCTTQLISFSLEAPWNMARDHALLGNCSQARDAEIQERRPAAIEINQGK
jgi:hypothetical protein